MHAARGGGQGGRSMIEAPWPKPAATLPGRPGCWSITRQALQCKLGNAASWRNSKDKKKPGVRPGDLFFEVIDHLVHQLADIGDGGADGIGFGHIHPCHFGQFHEAAWNRRL